MSPKELQHELKQLVQHKIMDPILIMGKSGIGKTSLVDQVFAEFEIPGFDVRWGQLAPVDARGVPVPDHNTKTTRFYTPDFWPTEAPAYIFLDEFNMATPVMMGLGQQLLTSRRFGDYVVPDGVFIWAAGNHKVDRAAVHEIPAPVNNRLGHYELNEDMDSWEAWAFSTGIDARIIGFLKWRPELLHKFNENAAAWPSPRSWEMADRRLKANLSVASVVGDVAVDFDSYIEMILGLPNIENVALGKGDYIDFPDDPSMKYAVTSGLTRYSLRDYQTFVNCFSWMASKCGDEAEWVQNFILDLMRLMGDMGKKREKTAYLTQLQTLPAAVRFLEQVNA